MSRPGALRKILGRVGVAACLAVAAGGTVRSAELTDGIAAVVNDDIITFTDIKSMVGQTEETLRKTYSSGDPELAEKIRQTRKEALDQLIERRLIIQQFNNRGGKVPDSYVEDEIQSTIDEQYDRNRSLFIKTLEALGLSLETFKERVREKIIVRYMQQNEVTNEILISPYKIEKYYQEHAEDFKEGEKVKLRLIYVKNGNGADGVETARAQAQDILVKLATGSSFESLASVYSDDPHKKEGGEMGYVTRDTLRAELADAAFALKPGQLSKVIETKDGFYILLVEDRKPEKVETMEEAHDHIERLLIQQERERLQKRWIESLRRKAYIRTYIGN